MHCERMPVQPNGEGRFCVRGSSGRFSTRSREVTSGKTHADGVGFGASASASSRFGMPVFMPSESALLPRETEFRF
jgi:hypothetical protein